MNHRQGLQLLYRGGSELSDNVDTFQLAKGLGHAIGPAQDNRALAESWRAGIMTKRP